MRDRIVLAAADLVLQRGAQGTSLDDICAATSTSKSQLFHYFPGGKGELVTAIGALQAERVLDAQRPYLDKLDTWASWDRWRGYLQAGLTRMTHTGRLRANTNPRTLLLAIFAALQGGLALTAMTESIEPIQAALDGALATLRANAATQD
jgi:AcrR family transcriptional regulator